MCRNKIEWVKGPEELLCCDMKLGLNITGGVSLILLILYLIMLIDAYDTNEDRIESLEINVVTLWIWLAIQVIRVIFWLLSFKSGEVHKRNQAIALVATWCAEFIFYIVNFCIIASDSLEFCVASFFISEWLGSNITCGWAITI